MWPMIYILLNLKYRYTESTVLFYISSTADAKLFISDRKKVTKIEKSL